jgi:glyoxylase-like metal-dependent hydrolase (beta-lactamase superfamily II)
MGVEQLVTSGIFSLDGQDFDVDNNVWIVGDDHEVIVIDAAHDAAAILAAVGERRLRAVVCTHAHNDHINAATEVADATGAPILLNHADLVLWDMLHPLRRPDGDLVDGQEIQVGGHRLRAIHTPGHAPGATCLYLEAKGILFSGDTLFQGGPGATGRSYSSYDDILDSIEHRLLTLPPETVVNTGHGPSTTIGDEAKDLAEWRSRQ